MPRVKKNEKIVLESIQIRRRILNNVSIQTNPVPIANNIVVSSIDEKNNDSLNNAKENQNGLNLSLSPRSRTYIQTLYLGSEQRIIESQERNTNQILANINQLTSALTDFRASLLNVPSSSPTLPDLHCQTSISVPILELMFDSEAELKEFEERLNKEAYRDKVVRMIIENKFD
ncbi:unnamed protein product [Diamesa serratosioi]